MWKLLPILFLVACTVTGPQQSSSNENHSTQGRIVRQVALSLTSSSQTVDDQPAKVTFQSSGISGWLDETGAWHISTEVQHSRLLCGTYEAGMQLGSGNPDCSNVDWLPDVVFATRLMHCNSATRLHVGDGEFSDLADRFEEVTCVRIVIRCEGAC